MLPPMKDDQTLELQQNIGLDEEEILNSDAPWAADSSFFNPPIDAQNLKETIKQNY